jgi:ubiquinone/menaquinone biosynthesis C-methylase UbiE
MRISTEELASSLCCPDDQEALRAGSGALECNKCGRVYSAREGEILELLPKKPAEAQANRQYAADYLRQFHRNFEDREEAVPWGLAEARSRSWKLHRERQAQTVLSLLTEGGTHLQDLILCDVSAGVGDYTLSYARHFKWVFHCDLSVDALRYASGRSRRIGLENVFFLRVDYFALPFSRSIDRLLCLDTLVRGKDHERALLIEIQKALSGVGRAIIDFHHWWHNPLRRLGLLRQNFGNNRSYARRGAEGLMRECGIENWRLLRFCQELEPTSPKTQWLSWFLPATRLVYEFASAVSGPPSSRSAKASVSAASRLDPPDADRRAAKTPDA